jgi:hypothetical protein
MLEPRQRFIDLATRPLAGKQADHDLARGELMDRLAHARPAEGDDLLETATGRLEERHAPPAWQTALGFAGALALAGLILAGVLHAAWREMKDLNPLYRFFPLHSTHQEEWEARITAGVEAGRRDFLLANTEGFASEAQEAGYAAAAANLPEDPADFEELMAYYRTSATTADPASRRTVSELMDHAGRIDPGNGWWPLVLAQIDNGMARPGGTFASHGTSDLARPDSIWKTIEGAAAQARFESHIPKRTARRLEMMGPAEDIAAMVSRQRFAERQRSLSDSSRGEVWVKGAEELTFVRDPEGLKRWIATWENLTRRQLQPDRADFLGTEVIFRIPQVARVLSHFTTRMALPDESARMDRWTKEANAILTRSPAPGPRRYAMTVSGSRQAFIADDREFEPGRRAEFALADRYLALAAACLFTLLALFAALESWRRPREIRGMAQGLSPLLRPVDFAWLAALGIVVPLAWHVGVTRFTPLGCRDFALTEWDMIPAWSQAGGSFLLATCLLLQTSRWRIAKRGGFLALRPPALWPGWAAAAVAALFVPSLGAVRFLTKWQEEFLLFGSSAAGVPLLWLLWRGGAIAFGPRSAALGGVLSCRMLFPAFLAMAGLLLALMPLLKSEERRWVARDAVGGTDPAGSGLGLLEARTQSALRQQLLEALK